MDAKWYTPGEAARRAGYSPTHIIHLIKVGALRAERTVSGRYVIAAKDVDAFVNERAARP